MDDFPVNEKALWLAVLIQTTADLVGLSLPTNKRRENIHVRSARECFEGNGDEIGWFVWVCQTLGIDAASYRRRMYKIAQETPEKFREMRLHEWNAGRNARKPYSHARRVEAARENQTADDYQSQHETLPSCCHTPGGSLFSVQY